MFWLKFLLAMTCTVAYAFQQETNPADSEREKDVYAIYSLMLTDVPTSHGADNNERYIIAATTAAGRPTPPCVLPPAERKAEFAEVLADYELHKSTSRHLLNLA